ncbi:ROK family protein [Nakamurella lactea]|uniref:ROK family protein n=1 Tax=Nakamurella lactea TaxID=459515 RepID=UPI00040E2FE0|nr:ROK family protein [Nakamurella lactea]
MRLPVVLGFDFGGTKMAIAASDLDGNRLAEVTVPTVAETGAAANLRRGIDAATGLLASLGPNQLIAVGACTFGIPGESGVELAPAIPGWEQLRLRRELGRAFRGAAIRLATDVKAAALAEYENGALAGCDPGIYLNLGTGLAAAVVVNGTVLTGRNGASGEIGYNLRALTDVGRGPAERSLLEEAVSGIALGRLASAHAGGAVTATDVFAGIDRDERWAGIVTAFVGELAFHLVNLAIAIDPARIVVGGGMVAAWDQLYADLRQALDAGVPYPPELEPARFPFDAPLRGALSMGLAAVRPPADAAGPSTTTLADEREL